jgi:hypothetical protein
MAKTLSGPTGQLWPSELISRQVGISVGSPSMRGMFMEVVVDVGTTRGIVVGRDRAS